MSQSITRQRAFYTTQQSITCCRVPCNRASRAREPSQTRIQTKQNINIKNANAPEGLLVCRSLLLVSVGQWVSFA